MGFEQYKGRQWKVVWNDDQSKCTEGDIVTFDGKSEEVNIRCKRYDDGKYDGTEEEPGKIVVGGYEITMMVNAEGKAQIKCAPIAKGEGSVTGSWTAQDHGPWRGDG